jgi:hypothetical protein
MKKPVDSQCSVYLTARPLVKQNLNRGSTRKTSMKAHQRISFQDINWCFNIQPDRHAPASQAITTYKRPT